MKGLLFTVVILLWYPLHKCRMDPQHWFGCCGKREKLLALLGFGPKNLKPSH